MTVIMDRPIPPLLILQPGQENCRFHDWRSRKCTHPCSETDWGILGVRRKLCVLSSDDRAWDCNYREPLRAELPKEPS